MFFLLSACGLVSETRQIKGTGSQGVAVSKPGDEGEEGPRLDVSTEDIRGKAQNLAIFE